jgi:2,5-furandicarboxylate decarboxylase 1
VRLVGDEVDLYKLPIPMSSIYDGGPMITAGVVIARDPELGVNSGIYRFLVKEKNLTGIDIVTPNNMRLFAQRAYEAGRPCPISISIGVHPLEIMGSGYRAPLGVDEMAIAGGLPMPRSCSRPRFYPPAGRGRRAASASSRGSWAACTGTRW